MRTPQTLIVSAGVRYWEDATVNGVQDDEGTLIPFRSGDLWKPRIDLETGRVLDWQEGTTAKIHYKVCDAGEYWIEDEAGDIYKWTGDYVPNDFLCHGDRGYGDYIIFNVGADGLIEKYRKPDVDENEWIPA